MISLTGRKAARNSSKDLRDHGWFVFFAPRDNPEIAGVIFAEHAEHGYSAAPIARHMIATYFAKKRGEPLPVFTAPGVPPPTPPQEEVPIEPDATTPVADASLTPTAEAVGPSCSNVDSTSISTGCCWPLLLTLSLMGIAMIYSATQATTPRLYQQQVYALLLGSVALIVALSIDYRTLADKSHWIYIGVVLLLIYVMFFGVVRGGARRWIPLGPVQPAAVGVRQDRRRARAGEVLRREPAAERRRAPICATGAAMVALPFLLIARQPDLGTAVTLLPVYLFIAYVAGLPLRMLGMAALVGVLVAPLAWKFALKDYQKERIETFINPYKDPKGAGYQQIQARITVGSGGLTGKGFTKGTQGQLRFLPVAHNDFIFSAWAEEEGFIGVIVALGLYLLVIWRALEAAQAVQGPARRVPRAGRPREFHVPGVLQHHHVGGTGAGEGVDAAADELWRQLAHRDAGGVWADPERPDAALHQLKRRGGTQFRAPPAARREGGATASVGQPGEKDSAVTKEMIISSNDHETRVAILEDDLVAEIFVERERSRGVVGNVYKGRVSKVLPGMQSSFVDIGLERDGFLYVTDVVPVARRLRRRRRGRGRRGRGRLRRPRAASRPNAPTAAAAAAAADASRGAPTRRASPGTSRRSRTCSRKGRT